MCLSHDRLYHKWAKSTMVMGLIRFFGVEIYLDKTQVCAIIFSNNLSLYGVGGILYMALKKQGELLW